MPILFYLLSFICIFVQAYPEENREERKKICLNMIVKDESKIITRCLATVKPLVDYWVIDDTGSSDGTQKIIKEFMKDVPGELHETPWKNFEYNRNHALKLAQGKADYIMLMDADEMLEFSPDFKLPVLQKDFYDSVILHMGLQYNRPLLLKDGLDWKWYGVLHEYISATQAKTTGTLEGLKKISTTEGARAANLQKYQKDAQILEAALEEDPTNSRYIFYLAQSYRDAGDYPSALKTYEKRVKIGGWDQEVFYSMLQIARLQEITKADPEIIMKSYYDAYHYRPGRAEPLYSLAKYYRSKNDFAAAYLVASIGRDIPMTKDVLFVEKWVYDYDMQLECSISAYWIGKYDECQKISKEILNQADLSQNIRETVEKNLGFANAKILERLRGS